MTGRPNVVLIMTDQQRADLCAREGYPLDTTPFLDELAAGGTWFNRAYTAVPVCVPARICMLTGRWAGATRVRHNSFRFEGGRVKDAPEKGGADRGAPVYTRDIFHVMRDAGYRTALSGKNHSHLTPDRAGFWSPYGHTGGRAQQNRSGAEVAFDDYLAQLHNRADFAPAPFPLECQGPYRIVRDAISWIEGLSGAPFFLWLSFPEPHNPYQVPAPYFDMFPPDALPPLRSKADDWSRRSYKWRSTRRTAELGHPDYEKQLPRARSNYHGMLRLLDDQVRRFVGFLDEAGLRENTIIVFVSDHGDFVGEYGLVRKGPEMPDVLMRVPMIWHGPGIAARGGAATAGPAPSVGAGSGRGTTPPHPAHVSIVDIFPTICEAIGVELPAGVQGRSLWPLLCGGAYPEEEFASVYGEHGMGGLHHEEGDSVIAPTDDGLHPGVGYDGLTSVNQSGFMRMVRKGDWKLDFDMQGRGQLYNLAKDPVELNNRFGSPETAAIERELLADLLAWSMRADDPLPLPNARYRMKLDPRNWWSAHRSGAGRR